MAVKTYTTGEVAKQIGVSRQTLQAWIADEKIEAPVALEVGRVTVRLWTTADVARVRKFKGRLKPGPKPKR
jgi:excisionase family DNA binding protein